MVARIRDFMSGYGWPVLVAVTLFVLGAVFETKLELVQLKQEVQSLREDIQEVKTEIKEIHAILYIPFNSEGQTGVSGPRQVPETIGLLGPSQGISIPKLPRTEKSTNSGKSIVFSLAQRATEGKSRNGLSDLKSSSLTYIYNNGQKALEWPLERFYEVITGRISDGLEFLFPSSKMHSQPQQGPKNANS